MGDPYATRAPGPRSDLYGRIYAVVRRIPRGRVGTYGQMARLAGIPRGARQVGYALYALPVGTTVPWQRVVNARGEVSPRREGLGEVLQRAMLEREGVPFDARGRIDLSRYGWNPGPVGDREGSPMGRGIRRPRSRRASPRGARARDLRG